MKLEFDDKSYIEIIRLKDNNKVMITIAARDSEKPLATIINSVELSDEQFKKLLEV